MFDAENPDALMNEALIAFFVPAILLFVGAWAAVSLVFADALAALHPALAEPITPKDGAGALAGGVPRFLLVMVATATLMLPYLGVYVRVVRPPLSERGWV